MVLGDFQRMCLRSFSSRAGQSCDPAARSRLASSSSLPPDLSHQVRIVAFAGSLWWAASALGLVLYFVEEG